MLFHQNEMGDKTGYLDRLKQNVSVEDKTWHTESFAVSILWLKMYSRQSQLDLIMMTILSW